MAQSILQYGVTTWSDLSVKANNKIFRVQKIIIKIILKNDKTSPTVNLFEESKFTLSNNYFTEMAYVFFI